MKAFSEYRSFQENVLALAGILSSRSGQTPEAMNYTDDDLGILASLQYSDWKSRLLNQIDRLEFE